MSKKRVFTPEQKARRKETQAAWAARNPERRREAQARWDEKNPGLRSKRSAEWQKENYDTKVRNKLLLWNYGITTEDYEAIRQAQDGCCAICGAHELDIPRRLCVDHCHSTGKIRGLLCDHCNSMLGHAKDTTEVLRKAAVYLENSRV